jgi:hypothetical protein
MYPLPQSSQRRPTGAATQNPNSSLVNQDNQMQHQNESHTTTLPPVQPQLSPLQGDGLLRMDPFFSSGQQGTHRDPHTTVVSPFESP